MTQPPPAPPAPPPAAPQPAAQGASGPRANFGQRLVAYVIDIVIVGIVAAIGFAINDALGYVLAFVLGLVYFAYFEGSPSGQTLGKKLLKIRVIDFNTGGPIGFGRAIVRYISRILSGLVCYLGYLWMLWDREKQTWHDKLGSTVVVPESAYPVSSWPG
jgi:uncharacterized RDD family membrane protein YckC